MVRESGLASIIQQEWMMSGKFAVMATLTDKRMRQWSVALRPDRLLNRRIADFSVWPPDRLDPSSRPIGLAYCIADGLGDAKVEDFRIDPPYQNAGIGSALLAEVEKWAAREGIRRLYGDLAKVDSDHFTMLRHLYMKHGWKWCLFSERDPRFSPTSHVAGTVEKVIPVITNQQDPVV